MKEALQINKDSKTLYQSIDCIIPMGSHRKKVRIELRYLECTEKWYLSMFNSETGESYFRYVPVIACDKDINDLIAPFYYKDTGVILCKSIVDEPSSVNPGKFNLSEFMILWGDSID